MYDEKRIIIDNGDGSVSVLVPSPGYSWEEIRQHPDVAKALEKPHRTVDVSALPTDRLFRAAWCPCPAKGVRVDLDRAKALCHDLRRKVRSTEFEPLDKAIAAQIPGTDVAEVEAQRQAIREQHAALQAAIDEARDEAELRNVAASLIGRQ